MSTNDWIAPEHITLPHFIMCGAMKAGTSTLHHILNSHPHIHIPNNEIHFFDIDNVLQHQDFNYFDGSTWVIQRLDDDPINFWRWYASHFDGAAKNQIIGEDSTTYLASEIAAKRISLQRKKIKLIAILRHPTARAHSQYWHMVRTGRAMLSFEDTIRFEPYSILYRSLYHEQLRHLFRHVSREQVQVVILEEFLMNKHDSLREICAHIDVDYDLLPKDSIDSHMNKGLFPKYPAIHILRNRVFREAGGLHYASDRPVKPDPALGKGIRIGALRFLDKVHRKMNPLIEVRSQKIQPSTGAFLDDFFKRELEGLNDLLGRDVMSIWFD